MFEVNFISQMDGNKAEWLYFTSTSARHFFLCGVVCRPPVNFFPQKNGGVEKLGCAKNAQ